MTIEPDDPTLTHDLPLPVGTHYENPPICPWCEQIADDIPWDWNLSDGESAEAECAHCEKPITITCNISVTYSTTARRDPPDPTPEEDPDR